ncbi:tol-pal system YbgF family protein [Roseivirga sp. E12]|uniref:tetratricopeptide repeat protein n=1 Tax=Roseivirga sp. E12 TaxID=2819237 RepID=UPI001ABC531D|nr:hypothetical protein [Roseivirga sp. E12]MBO3699666.1 hypothetical protein [Roseivirga sp. E12]
MNSEVDIALLEQYLAGEIERSQVLTLDGKTVSDDVLQVAIKDYKETVLHLEGAALKNQLKGLHETLDLDEKKSAFPRWLAVAASIVLIAVFGILIWQNNRASEFSDYFDHFDQLVTYRDSDSTDYSAGLEAYTLRDYDKAYSLLTSVDGLNNELKFYQAVSALGSERYDDAIALFETLGTSSSNKYYQQTRWYLALAYWQVGLAGKARNLLKEIDNGEFMYQESLKLIDELRD